MTTLLFSSHLLVAPVLLPLATAAVMVWLGERRRMTKAVLNSVSALLGPAMGVGLFLLMQVH